MGRVLTERSTARPVKWVGQTGAPEHPIVHQRHPLTPAEGLPPLHDRPNHIARVDPNLGSKNCRFRRFQGCRSATMAAAGADMRRQPVRRVALRCAHCLRPRLHARPVDVDRPDVLTLRFLIRQCPNWALPQIGLWTARLPVSHTPWVALQPPSTPLTHSTPVRSARAACWHLLLAEIATFQFISVVAQIGAPPKIHVQPLLGVCRFFY